ncbi:MAG: hypothetical protein UU16_C0013G0007 [Candidatus Woesebacteria bacterium GW2011_GWA2_40_7]|uniref:Uncharacterized protein n=3 Tax=Candidatus Woeseibacteriota TaxID=1752722 RepID=A0A0G0LJ82_9BACT|nr:MAG: hypothetical protein UT17_C0003G0001 [Candidatus Woesebacteria bacterium GW2011_GWB1_39_10]KKR73793.1 MAG: hypothetical protein UU16_C0013G0007 [Candidatus Woesebacteria bacterium GW2011_GWA2_40_7]KKS90938.1 MAG: hypothetical protein UV66_C0001G0295 [Candidatus Woesebacteria bacterium GW2011_GWA1_43_12]
METRPSTEHSMGDSRVIEKMNKGYEEALAPFSPEKRQKKEQLINNTFQSLSQRIATRGDFELTPERQAVLRLKLARHFQKTDEVDPSTLFDALVETPKFIDTDKGSLMRLMEVHQQKTLQRIAEARKRRAELGDKESFNPYENLFTTKSGNYYMARLLNMPHLEAESAYMKHCVGTSDSYINQIKRGDIEILSFRNVPKINQRTQKLEGDTPIITIEYNLRTNTIEQMKKKGDEYLDPSDPYYKDVIDALKQLRTTRTDAGKLRNFVKIQPSELENIKVRDGYVLTESGETSFRNFNPDSGLFVFKLGKMPIEARTSRQDASKIVRLVEGLNFQPEEIAITREQVTSRTKIFIGKPFPGFFKWLPDSIQHVYTSFPEGKVVRESVVAGGKTGKEYEQVFTQRGINISGWAKDMMGKPEFVTLRRSEKIDLVRLTIGGLGFTDNPTTDQLYQKAQELGLELCPPEVGPELRLKYQDQPLYEWTYIGMKQIADSDGYPYVFGLERSDDGLWLYGRWAEPTDQWALGHRCVFRIRK